MNASPTSALTPAPEATAAPARHYGKALLAGLAGGVVGTAIKTLGEAVAPPRPPGTESPLGIGIRMISVKFTGSDLDPPTKKVAEMAVHWGFGILTGALYAVIAERWRTATLAYGVAFGFVFWVAAHEIFLPAVGWSPTPLEMSWWEQGNELVTHCLYGVGVEIVRRAVRARI